LLFNFAIAKLTIAN